MPESGVCFKPREEILTLEEIVKLVRIFAGLGIEKVRITGGEPLVRKGVEWLVAEIAGIPGVSCVAMTTNGVLLREKAHTLKDAGLTNLNVSLDTLQPERFVKIAGRDLFYRVIEGIESALSAGFSPLKINTVVMGGINDDEVLDFVELARDKPINVRFIEYMPFKSNGWRSGTFVPSSALKAKIAKRYKLILCRQNGKGSPIAEDYGIAGFIGKVSFISPMSEPFCDGCNRLRLTADGFIKPCLFMPTKLNVRDALRAGATDEKIAQIIRDALSLKWEEHPQMDALAKLENESMVEVGG